MLERAVEWYQKGGPNPAAELEEMGDTLSRLAHHMQAALNHISYSLLLEARGRKLDLLRATENVITPYLTLPFPCGRL